MKILVTGGCGYIGSKLVHSLRGACDIAVVDNYSNNVVDSIEGVTIHKLDIQNTCEMEDVFRGGCFDMVIHFAGISSPTEADLNPLENATQNYLASVALMKLAESHFVKKFLFASSYYVYEDSCFPLKETSYLRPRGAYGVNKLASEYFLKTMNMNSLSTRFFNVYGDGDRGIIGKILYEFSKSKGCLTIQGDGNQRLDFIHILDLINILKEIIFTQEWDIDTLNLGTGNSSSLNEIIRIMQKLTSFDVELKYEGGVSKKFSKITCDTSLLKEKGYYKIECSTEKHLQKEVLMHI